MSDLDCKKCKGKHKTKNGFVRGKQRYICKRCGSSFVEGDTRGKVPLSLKLQGLKLYISGLSLNRIAHLLNVSTPAVLRWIKAFGERFGERPQIEGTIVILELDEMWHYVNSKKTKSGSGRLMTVTTTDLSTGSAETALVRL